jgi:pterin-4a-carbinolamine dehydratase
MHILYLLPYSPDFNPIKEAFSAIKSWICANRDYACGKLSGKITCNPYQMIWDAVFTTVTPDKAEGWFHHSGYLV